MSQTFSKTEQLLAYISKIHSNVSVTSLMKLCYLVDLISFKKTKGQISTFTYRRYTFGPFDNEIYSGIKKLASNDILLSRSDFTTTGDEYVVYSFNDKAEFDFDQLSKSEIEIIDEVVDSLRGYGAKVLTELAYKTKPMLKFKATLGGNEHLNEILDLTAS